MALNWSELGMDAPSHDDDLAYELADQDAQLMIDLVKMRERYGLSQSDVAAALGVTQSTISTFERYDNDPKLSTIRRYALAVGARIRHNVCPAHESDDSSWLTGSGVLSVDYTQPETGPRKTWDLVS